MQLLCRLGALTVIKDKIEQWLMEIGSCAAAVRGLGDYFLYDLIH